MSHRSNILWHHADAENPQRLLADAPLAEVTHRKGKELGLLLFGKLKMKEWSFRVWEFTPTSCSTPALP